jgi:arsenite transporter
MSLLEKAQSLIILAAILVGLALGAQPLFSQFAGYFILPFLILMLTGIFLQLPLRKFKLALSYRRTALASLAINFIWTPLLAWLLGWLFLREQAALWIGFIMLAVTPCTDWYLVFTSIARGNLALSTALLPVNLVLQLLLLPVYLLLLAGAVFPVDLRLLLGSVALVIGLPLAGAIILRWILLRVKDGAWLDRKLSPIIQSGQVLFLGLAIAAMFASEGKVISQNPQVLFYLLPPLALFFIINMSLAILVGRLIKLDYESFASLCCTTLARNSPIVLAIALVAFPDQPLIPLSLVIAPLIELPVLSLVSQVLLWISRRGYYPANHG